jgi:hypothetical protein
MFEGIEQAGRRVDVLTVRYDRCLDYPVEIRGDQKLGLPRRLVLDHGGQPDSPALAVGAVASVRRLRARHEAIP